MVRLAMGLVAWTVATPAMAQGAFTLDSVLVVPPQASDELADQGDALHASLEAMLASEYLVVPFVNVPPYEDYSASVYVQSCPEDQYIGCTWVMGSRGNADWAIGMEMLPTPEGAEALFTIVDVEESRPVISFSSKVVRGNHGPVAAGLSLVLDSVIRGAGMESDVRGDVETPRDAWDRRREEARQAAEELAYADQGLQILVRPDVGEFDEPKLTVGDLQEYEIRDDDAPWVRVGMTKSAYVRFKNSGRSRDEWAQLASGRRNQFTLYLEGGFGNGSYTLVHDARWVLDDDTLEAVETEAVQQMQSGGTIAFALEATYGILPWFEAGLGIGTRTQRFRYFYQREIEGEDIPQPIADGQTLGYTPEYRLVTNFIPLPTFVIRPTGSLDLAFWSGTPIDRVVQVPGPVDPLPAPAYVMLHIAPGVEVSPNEVVVVYAKFNMEMLLSGTREWSERTGEALLQEPFDPATLKTGGGYTIALGVAIRLGPFWGKPKGPRAFAE